MSSEIISSCSVFHLPKKETVLFFPDVMSHLSVLPHCFQGDFKAFNPSGKSWSLVGPNPHFALQRNGMKQPVTVLVSGRISSTGHFGCLYCDDHQSAYNLCLSRAIKRQG